MNCNYFQQAKLIKNWLKILFTIKKPKTKYSSLKTPLSNKFQLPIEHICPITALLANRTNNKMNEVFAEFWKSRVARLARK